MPNLGDLLQIKAAQRAVLSLVLAFPDKNRHFT